MTHIVKVTGVFGYIKWTPDVAFTSNFLDFLLVSMSGEGWAKILPPKTAEQSLSSPVFTRQPRPWCHLRFMQNERLECEIKVSLGYYSVFYRYHTYKLY